MTSGTALDAGNAIALAWWTWALIVPSHVVFGTTHAFDAMRNVASERVWGMVTLGILIALVVTLGDVHRETHRLVLIACASFWASAATMIAISNTTAPGIGLYIAFALLTARRTVRMAGGG